ncbi:hypothetical protein DFR29_107275 [Tahibacter aquaticus]|uniref:Dolichyl-phosphate-mannose-protein mannosyltransferase n=1 Tax=Tahibacter aquaticus TaxID=520092 RepID=A0A4R6YX72_9GAMM|nr:hypothetical protein [Tahibacter aquaticus]TDR43262.1 hypothetical protein DFR29_107275 [Tahibacter aquaticus]
MSGAVLLAWAGAFLLGLAVWLALAGRPRQAGDWLAGSGYAVLLGLLACGGLVALSPQAPGAQLFAATLPWLALALTAAACAAFWRWRREAPALAPSGRLSPRLPYWCGLLLLAVLLRFVVLVDEAVLRPVFVWDAWNAWSLKAKTWFELGQVSYINPLQWWEPLSTGSHTALAWRYPELLSRVELYLAAAAGAWNESAVGLAWPIVWAALLCGCAGQWLALGMNRLLVLVLTYVLASLPLLSVHAGLAGYADLWVATALSFGVLAWLRWRQSRDRGQLALAVLCLLLLPLLKFEGAVWSLLVLGLALGVEMPPRWRWIGLAAAAGLVLLVLLAAWLLQMPWLALVRDTISGATGGSSDISRSSAALAFATGLFGQSNWHLLWPLLLGCMLWQRQHLRGEPGTLALLLGGGLAALFCLFVFTPAAKWAASETASNRLVLHWVPLAVSLLGLLLREFRWPGHTASETAH